MIYTMKKHVFSVTQINSYIHRIFESDYALKKIYLKGEVSNCKYHSSGHIYFTLKDEKSALRCIMFASDRFKGLTFRLEDGQLVEICGNISVYEQTGTYQMYARKITLAGAGELYIRYEQLKQELAEKGYFDFERKKPLPAFPESIGIVTALTGAAIEDIKSIAKRRNPSVQLYLYPAKVQERQQRLQEESATLTKPEWILLLSEEAVARLKICGRLMRWQLPMRFMRRIHQLYPELVMRLI